MRRWSRRFAFVVLMSLSLNACIFFEDEPTQTPCLSTKTDKDLCNELGGKCQMQETTDECGKRRIVACGCPNGKTCEMGMCVSPQVCNVDAPTAEEACAAKSFECGELTISVCDESLTLVCGQCDINSQCVNGTCVCEEPAVEPSVACKQAQCGSVLVPNVCDDGAQMITCGTCALGLTCGDDNQCKTTTLNGDGKLNAYFGGVVAVHGNMMAVSEFGANQLSLLNKRVLIYEYDDTKSEWTKRQTLEPDDPTDQGRETFGAALAISGEWLAIGAPGRKNDSEASEQAGAIYLYKRQPNAENPWVLKQTILGKRGGRLGTSLAIRDKVLVAGEPGPILLPAIKGYVYIYHLGSQIHDVWSKAFSSSLDVEEGKRLGEAVAIGAAGKRIAVSAPAFNDVGRVWLLKRVATAKWEVKGLMEADTTRQPHMNFGAALSFAGPFLFVGSNHAGNVWKLLGDDSKTVRKGEVEQFDLMSKNNNRFKSLGAFSHPQHRSRDLFGTSLAFDGRRLLVGAPGWDAVVTYGGSAVLYEVDLTNGNIQTANATLFQRDNPARNDFFGLSVALHERWGVIGIPGAKAPEMNSGIVRVLDLEAPIQGPALPPGM